MVQRKLLFTSDHSGARACTYATSRLDPKASQASKNTLTFHQGASITKPLQGQQQMLSSHHCVDNNNSNTTITRQQTTVCHRSRKPQALEGTCKL